MGLSYAKNVSSGDFQWRQSIGFYETSRGNRWSLTLNFVKFFKVWTSKFEVFPGFSSVRKFSGEKKRRVGNPLESCLIDQRNDAWNAAISNNFEQLQIIPNGSPILNNSNYRSKQRQTDLNDSRQHQTQRETSHSKPFQVVQSEDNLPFYLRIAFQFTASSDLIAYCLLPPPEPRELLPKSKRTSKVLIYLT